MPFDPTLPAADAAAATALDAIFAICTPDGVRRAGLHDILAACVDSSLIDLPHLAAHQRAPMTELLAVIVAAQRLYGPATTTPEQWQEALAGVPLAITPPPGCPGFLQPALTDYTQCNIGDIDTLGSAARHAVKSRPGLDIEAAAFALVGGLRRGFGGASHYSAARNRLLTVMIGDGTLASEVLALADALPVRAATGLADHLLWSRPWTDKEPLELLPLPIVDCRPLRLLPTEDGTGDVRLAWAGSRGSRVANDWLGDPHVPQSVERGVPYRLIDSRGWSHGVLHSVLFGSTSVRRPKILDCDGPRILRISSTHHTLLGLVTSHYETLLTADGRLWDTDRAADLSQRALAGVGAAETVVWASSKTLHDEEKQAPRAAAARGRVTTLAGMQSVRVVLQLLPRSADAAGEQCSIERMAVDAALTVWREEVRSGPITVATARATLQFERLARTRFSSIKDISMQLANSPQTHAVLHTIQGQFTPSQRASIRSCAADVIPYAAIAQLALVPTAQVDHAASRAVWMSSIRALAALRHGGPSVGAVLARSDYPEARLQTLLNASGAALVSLMDEVWRWLIAHDAESCVMTDLVALGLADAAGNAEAASDMRLRIGLTYAKAVTA